ncbi:MAG: SIMPL domain-containing protein [Hyphomonas sp.]|nr:SIMPL domain-containing protein [Hyphomonas sp.]MCB9972343.1 SIMPL domain-containing protein [Hyphomonas sp.]
MKSALTLAALLLSAVPAALAQSASPTGGRDYQEDVYVTPYWTRMPVIESIGRANMQVAPNRASFSVTYLETDKDAEDAMKLAVQRGKLAYDTAKKIAGDKAIVQSSVSVDPYYQQYRDNDGNRIENDRADKIVGYEARVTLNVEVEDIAAAGKARAGVLALSPESSTPLNMYLEATTEMNRAAYEAAVSDGAARAKATAEAAGTKLGKLLAVQEGSGPCLGRWTTSAGVDRNYYDRNYPMAAEAAPAPMARQQTVTVTAAKIGGRDVTITQADIDALDLPSDTPRQSISSSVCMIYSVGN